MSEWASILLPWPPTGNHYKRPRGRTWYLTAQAKAFHRDALEAVREAGNPQFGKARLKVRITAHPPDKRRRDIDNLLKVTLDSLQRVGVYADDCQIDDLRIVRRGPREGGYVVVEITALEDDNE